jgi:hypothetical protein
MGIKKNPIAAGVVGLVFGAVLGIVIDKYFNKCECNENISNAKMQSYASGPTSGVTYKYSFDNELKLAKKYKEDANTLFESIQNNYNSQNYNDAFFDSLKIYAFVDVRDAKNGKSFLYLISESRNNVRAFDPISSHLNDFDEKLNYTVWYKNISDTVEAIQRDCYSKIKDTLNKPHNFGEETFLGQNDPVM